MILEDCEYIFNSPIEQQFWDAWLRSGKAIYQGPYQLRPQYPIGRYFVDFAELETKTVIELDGFAAHSSTTDIANDRRREREIEAQGWHVIRFGGQEIHRDARGCAEEVARILNQRREDLGLNKGNLHGYRGLPPHPDGPVQLTPDDPHAIAQEAASDLDRLYFLEHPGETEYIRSYIVHEFPDAALPKLEEFILVRPELAIFSSEEVSIEPAHVIVREVRKGFRTRNADNDFIVRLLTDVSREKALANELDIDLLTNGKTILAWHFSQMEIPPEAMNEKGEPFFDLSKIMDIAEERYRKRTEAREEAKKKAKRARKLAGQKRKQNRRRN